MDLTIPLENIILNIRVAIILETEKGFVLGRGENKSFYHFLGGRVKAGENSLQAAKREILEEAAIEIEILEFVSVIENFWTEPDHKVQEICFVYKTEKQAKINPQVDLKEFTTEEMKYLDIRPNIIKQMLLEENFNNTTHYII